MTNKKKKHDRRPMEEQVEIVGSSQSEPVITIDLCQSDEDDPDPAKRIRLQQDLDDSVIVLFSTLPDSSPDNSVVFVQEVKPSPPSSTVSSTAHSTNSPQAAVNAILGQTIPRWPSFQRPIVIDGSNIARAHGQRQNSFSCKGIALAIQYFQKIGHRQITAMVPQHRRSKKQHDGVTVTQQWMLESLSRHQLVVFTPSRTLNGKTIASYDDRFIVELACRNGGVIVSNDNFRDIASENPDWRRVVQQRLLMYCFVGDIFMIPQDPFGRNQPNLQQFLSFPDRI